MRFSLLEKQLKKRGLTVAGIDEAGRGPWAGPLVSCACIIPDGIRLPKVNDSKKILPLKRKEIYEVLIKKCHFGIGKVSHTMIDKIGLGKALKISYKRAVSDLIKSFKCPGYLLIDGIGTYKFMYNRKKIQYETVKKGDTFVKCIAAASIIAKVTRDRLMKKYAKKYSKYAFDAHKGYGTRLHHKNLLKYGVCEIHRQSFEPIKAINNESSK
jgi:ribonuclease HII